jgi:hypothetical protein
MYSDGLSTLGCSGRSDHVQITIGGNDKAAFTALCSITAALRKVPMVMIAKGKNERRGAQAAWSRRAAGHDAFGIQILPGPRLPVGSSQHRGPESSPRTRHGYQNDPRESVSIILLSGSVAWRGCMMDESLYNGAVTLSMRGIASSKHFSSGPRDRP